MARALVFLADAPRGMASSAAVAEEIGTHPVVVRRLLGGIRHSGIVESRSGLHGGWALARDPSSVPLSDVYRAMNTDQRPQSTSPLDHLLASAEAAYIARLAERTVADLARRHTA